MQLHSYTAANLEGLEEGDDEAYFSWRLAFGYQSKVWKMLRRKVYHVQVGKENQPLFFVLSNTKMLYTLSRATWLRTVADI